MKEFKEMNITTICKELKGLTGELAKRSCDACIEDAAKIIEKVLFKEETKLTFCLMDEI